MSLHSLIAASSSLKHIWFRCHALPCLPDASSGFRWVVVVPWCQLPWTILHEITCHDSRTAARLPMGLLRERQTSSLKHREAGGKQRLMEETRSQSMTETHCEDSYSQELEHEFSSWGDTSHIAVGKKPNPSMDSWESRHGEASRQESNLHVSLCDTIRFCDPLYAVWLHPCPEGKAQGRAPKGRLTQHSGCPRGWLYLLSRMASSTWVLFSDRGAPREVWLMADRNFRSNLVLSVFPAPLSPLLRKKYTFHSQIQNRQSWWPSYP